MVFRREVSKTRKFTSSVFWVKRVSFLSDMRSSHSSGEVVTTALLDRQSSKFCIFHIKMCLAEKSSVFSYANILWVPENFWNYHKILVFSFSYADESHQKKRGVGGIHDFLILARFFDAEKFLKIHVVRKKSRFLESFTISFSKFSLKVYL